MKKTLIIGAAIGMGIVGLLKRKKIKEKTIILYKAGKEVTKRGIDYLQK